MFRYLFAFILVMHGLAHVTGVLLAFSPAPEDGATPLLAFSERITAQSAIGRAWTLVWLLSLAGLVGAGIGLALGKPWWSALAVAAAVTSLVAILPWIRAVPAGAWAGAVLDAIVICALVPPWSARILSALG